MCCLAVSLYSNDNTVRLQPPDRGMTYSQARAHIHIKGGLSTCPFSSSRESALFSGEFFFFFFSKLIYVYMCAFVFLFAHIFPCQTNKKNLNIRSGQEVRLSSSDAFIPSASRRRRGQHSDSSVATHWSTHAHHKRAENRRSEAPPLRQI